MGSTSPSMLDGLVSAAVNGSSILSPIRSSTKSPGEYQLQQLEPRPDPPPPLDDHLPRPRLRKPAAAALEPERERSSGPWHDSPSSRCSASPKLGQLPMFSGPPPPIAASAVMHRGSSSSRFKNSRQGSSGGLFDASRADASSILLDQRRELASRTSDSVWRGLRRREQALEHDFQHLLDLQAAALVAGSAGNLDSTPRARDVDGHSSAGSSTPTGTLYSGTASSSSRAPNKSLYMPPQSTPEGNVIPVRQPAGPRPMGLRAARNGLQKSMAALVDLRREEDAHVDAALSERKTALARLNRLGARRSGICDELRALEGDGEEPLGKELRQLDAQHDALDREIRLLEEKLMGMRNRRRWLRDRTDDVRNRREAGLSGYRGALKDVDARVSALMRRPPVQPLDHDMLNHSNGPDAEPTSTGGTEFMRLIPERRTAEMARTWWKAEIGVLERQKAAIDAERQALEEGAAAWQQVMELVADFESKLRRITKEAMAAPSASPSAKGKEKMPSGEELVRSQLHRMDDVVAELEQRMQLAERKRWNLLICAIGAELEAFNQARAMLKGVVDGADGGGPGRDEGCGESDNEVPADLLMSRLDDVDRESTAPPPRRDSENEVPPEFLAEHDRDGHPV